jgi:tetratricopeptide (TPR) repeat protein
VKFQFSIYFEERARLGRSSMRLTSNLRDTVKEYYSTRGRVESQPGRLRSLFFSIAIILYFAGQIFAADVASDFSAANELYAKGKFGEAAAAYEKIFRTGGQSPALLFNYGNAEFKAGHVGKAIAAYRRAELLAPRDAEIRANLDFIRKQSPGPPAPESRWQDWPGQLTLNEWTGLAAIAFWLTFFLLAAKQIRPAITTKLRSATRLAFVLMICSGGILTLQAATHFNSSVAVVTVAEATARSGPFDDAQSAFTAHDGVEFSVLDHHGDWVQVADGAGKIGWLSRKQVEILPGA